MFVLIPLFLDVLKHFFLKTSFCRTGIVSSRSDRPTCIYRIVIYFVHNKHSCKANASVEYKSHVEHLQWPINKLLKDVKYSDQQNE